MKTITTSVLVASASVAIAAPAGQEAPLDKRLENGLGRTPALGYNNWVSVGKVHIELELTSAN